MGDVSQNFNRSEFECGCGCGFNAVDIQLVLLLEAVRQKFKKPVTINSACRCAKYNSMVGGVKNSKHLLGVAADIVVDRVHPNDVSKYLNKICGDRCGIGKYKSFTHIDVRKNKARWGG